MNKLVALLLLVLFSGCISRNECVYNAPVDKNDGLRVSTLDEQQLNQAVFETINAQICEGVYGNVHSLLVIHNNHLVIEQYYNNWSPESLHFLASTTKSFNALLMGKAIELGKISSVNQTMLSFFPEYHLHEKDSLKARITIENLLTMTTGFDWDELSVPYSDPENKGAQMDQMDNWVMAALDLPMKNSPGTEYVYCGPASIILGEIIKRTTGLTILDFAREQLFGTLGINEYEWAAKNGIYDSSGGLSLKARDIAKYALLHLNNGNWEGKQIVSEQWMKQMFEPYIEINTPFYSCYQWRMVQLPGGMNVYFISGYGGQIIQFIPQLDMVVVVNADNRQIPNDKRVAMGKLMQELALMHPSDPY